jgi:hypothetical protein
MTASGIAHQAVAQGYASEDELRRIADGWRAWAQEADGWFSVPQGEALCRA